LLKDESWCQGEVYDKLKETVSELPQDIAKQLDAIKRNKLDWHNDDEGINIDEELDEEEIGARFTKLQPETDRRRRDNRGPRDDRRTDRQRRRNNFDEEGKEEQQREQAPRKKQERFNANKIEDFPTL